jgi:hypothetical protein
VRVSVAPAGSRTASISSIRSPYTVPWPQPVVTVFFPRAGSFFFARVVTAAESVSQSTCTASIASIERTSRWLRR